MAIPLTPLMDRLREYRITDPPLSIYELLEGIVVDISQLQTDVQSLKDAGQAAATELGDLAAQIVSLQQQGAGAVTQADLDSLAASVEGTVSTLTAATSAATGQPTGGTVPTPPAAATAGEPTPPPEAQGQADISAVPPEQGEEESSTLPEQGPPQG